MWPPARGSCWKETAVSLVLCLLHRPWPDSEGATQHIQGKTEAKSGGTRRQGGMPGQVQADP